MTRTKQLQHPLIEHHLCTLRSIDTSPAEFRATVSRLAMLLGVYATEDLPTSPTTVTTPIADCPSRRLVARVGLVPILRAGLGLVEPLHQLIPDAEVWHLGIYRNEETAEPVHYYEQAPSSQYG
ncbi:MAG: uracil phosphoribosyltransferase [Pirellulaceae bacterium]